MPFFEPVTEILELLATDVLLFHNDIVFGTYIINSEDCFQTGYHWKQRPVTKLGGFPEISPLHRINNDT